MIPRFGVARAILYVATVEVRAVDPASHSADGNQPRSITVYRDHLGRVRKDSFYDSGRLMGISFWDPAKPVITTLQVVAKTGFEAPSQSPDRELAKKTWTTIPLPPRKILGLDTVGFRYVRTPAKEGGVAEHSGLVVEDWFSPEACVVLLHHLEEPKTGTRDEEVTKLERVEPDAKLFEVPKDFKVTPWPAPVQK